MPAPQTRTDGACRAPASKSVESSRRPGFDAVSNKPSGAGAWRRARRFRGPWLVLLAFLTGWTADAVPTGWETNLTTALATAAKQNQPVLLYFTASWCGPCKLMARTTLTNETVLRILTGVRPAAVDMDAQGALAEQRGVRAVPTFLMLSPSGTETARTTGYQPAPEFAQWLTNNISAVRTAILRQTEMTERLTVVGQLMQADDEESGRKAARALFDLCAETDDAIRKSAIAKLTTLAGEHPLTVLDGLNHPRLAARIAVANAVRTRLGETFDVDPWTDAATRNTGVSRWRDRLSAGAHPEQDTTAK